MNSDFFCTQNCCEFQGCGIIIDGTQISQSALSRQCMRHFMRNEDGTFLFLPLGDSFTSSVKCSINDQHEIDQTQRNSFDISIENCSGNFETFINLAVARFADPELITFIRENERFLVHGDVHIEILGPLKKIDPSVATHSEMNMFRRFMTSQSICQNIMNLVLN